MNATQAKQITHKNKLQDALSRIYKTIGLAAHEKRHSCRYELDSRLDKSMKNLIVNQLRYEDGFKVHFESENIIEVDWE